MSTSKAGARGLAAVSAVAAVAAISALASTVPNFFDPLLAVPHSDKWGHFLLMGGCAAVLVWSLAERRVLGVRLGAGSWIAIALALVSIEEVLQVFSPLRSPSWADLAASFAGVLLLGGSMALTRRGRASPSITETPPPGEETVEILHRTGGMRIERIVSRGHRSPAGFWYDQDEGEWVTVVAGRARLRLADPDEVVELGPGDWIDLPAHRRHRVEWTDPKRDTVWLAVFYPAGD